MHRLRRVRIAGIAIGIIHRAFCHQAGACGQEDRLFKLVAKLPVEIILRHRQQHFGFAIRVDRAVTHVLAAKMHVRGHAVEVRIALNELLTFQPVLLHTGWHHESTLTRNTAGHDVRWRFFMDKNTDLGRINSFLPGGRVVHLQ